MNDASEKCVNATYAASGTQTETWPKIKQNEVAITPKRSSVTQSPRENTSKKKKDTNAAKEIVYGTESTPEATRKTKESLDDQPQNAEWQEVLPRTRKKGIRPVKPDVLIIKACGETSYAEILRKVKCDPRLNTVGENVKGIRKTEKGELLLQLSKAAHENTGEFRNAIKDALGPIAEVRAKSEEVFLEIKDIDEITTKEEVYEALTKVSDEFKFLQTSAIKSMRRAYGSTQTATIALDPTLATILLRASKIRIGWVVCRIRKKIVPTKCYRCFNFGHIATRCNSPNDYSNCCMRCGGNDHKIKTCTKNVKCLICKDTDVNNNHVTASTACPQYRKAYQKLQTQ